MESNYKTYLFLHIPAQTLTGIMGLERVPSEMHLVATIDTKFDMLFRQIASAFNRDEQKQTLHAQRKLIVANASNADYAKEIAQTKI